MKKSRYSLRESQISFPCKTALSYRNFRSTLEGFMLGQHVATSVSKMGLTNARKVIANHPKISHGWEFPPRLRIETCSSKSLESL